MSNAAAFDWPWHAVVHQHCASAPLDPSTVSLHGQGSPPSPQATAPGAACSPFAVVLEAGSVDCTYAAVPWPVGPPAQRPTVDATLAPPYPALTNPALVPLEAYNQPALCARCSACCCTGPHPICPALRLTLLEILLPVAHLPTKLQLTAPATYPCLPIRQQRHSFPCLTPAPVPCQNLGRRWPGLERDTTPIAPRPHPTSTRLLLSPGFCPYAVPASPSAPSPECSAPPSGCLSKGFALGVK